MIAQFRKTTLPQGLNNRDITVQVEVTEKRTRLTQIQYIKVREAANSIDLQFPVKQHFPPMRLVTNTHTP